MVTFELDGGYPEMKRALGLFLYYRILEVLMGEKRQLIRIND